MVVVQSTNRRRSRTGSEGENDRHPQLDLNAHPPLPLPDSVLQEDTYVFSSALSGPRQTPPPAAQESSSFLSPLLRPRTPPSPRATMASATDPISIDDEDMDPSGENQVINEVRPKRATSALGSGGDGRNGLAGCTV